MNTVLRAGVVLGFLVEVWTLVMGYTGWYKHPALLYLFFLVIPIQIATLIWALRKTAAEGRRYWGQVSAGVLISAIAGIIIVVGSLLFTTMFFPDYFQELSGMQEQMMHEAGKSEAEIRAALDAAANTNTPIAQAIGGLIGTLVTGLVASLAIGGFWRAR